MESNNSFKTILNESENLEKKFLKLICDKSQLLCKTSSNPIPEEDYNSCNRYFKSCFESAILVSSDANLTASSSSKSICGRIFKSREPVYICRDCSTDETCVFCRVCFGKSEHTKHSYEMHLSSGGGYCDCGDEEAWKSFPRCSLHGGATEISPNISTETFETMDEITLCLLNISDDVKINYLKLAILIFQNFKKFVMRPLCKANHDKREEELNKELKFVKKHVNKNKIDELGVVLYNNEFHNFDQVITLFRRCLQCTNEQAMTFANIVDRDGRCMALLSNDREEVLAKQSDILSRSKHQTSMELLCRIQHPLILSLQNFLINALRWLYEFTDRYPMLRILLCQYLFSDDNEMKICDTTFPKCSFIQDIFDNHVELWKSARNVCTNFLMTGVFKETFFKKLYAIKLAQNYKMMVEHFSSDDHNPEDSLVSLICQLFTIISFAKYLTETHDILFNIMNIVYDTLVVYAKPLVHRFVLDKSILHFNKVENEVNKKFDPFERRMKSLNDLKYLLKSLVTAYIGFEENEIYTSQLWTENATENFIKYFRVFANFLSLIQDTDTIERFIETHVEHDPNWKTGIVMMYDSIYCISLTAKLLVSNTVCWDQSFEILRQVINTRIVDLEINYIEQFELFSYTTSVISNEWPSRYMSVIKPLHRFMAALLIDKKHRDSLEPKEKDCLLDQALQVVVFTSQQAGNMWIRNGSVPYILTQQIKCLSLAHEMFDRDLQLIQQMALSMSKDEFILKCIHKFDLKSYFNGDPCKQTDKKALLQRIEDFLHLLILTIFYRYRIGVGKDISQQDIYSHMLLHILCIKPVSHSKLMKKLTPALQAYPKGKLMDIIEKVADQSLHSQVVIFNAKRSLMVDQFDRFNPYFSIQDRNEAELWVKNYYKKESISNAMIPPKPIDLIEDCKELYEYISNPCFVEILNKFLYFCYTKRNGEFWTDTILDMVLYLIGASLHEDTDALTSASENRRTLFLETATNGSVKCDIYDYLEGLCDKISCDQQLELIKWIIRKWNNVLRLKNSVNKDIQPKEEISEVEMVDKEADNVQVSNQNKIAKADAAKKRREQLMSKMWNMQKKFIDENSKLLTENTDQKLEINNEDCVDSKMRQLKSHDLTCILCQEKNPEDNNGRPRPIVLIAGAWRSAVLAKHPFINKLPEQLYTASSFVPHDPLNNAEEFDDNSFTSMWINHSEDENNDIDRVVTRSIVPMLDHAEETFISSCGHIMHYDCKTNYMKDMIKVRQNVARTKGVLYPRIYNRCPLCKCVCNIDIPLIMENSTSELNESKGNHLPNVSFTEWIEMFNRWTPNPETKKVDNSVRWWNKLGNFMNFMKSNNSESRGNDNVSDNDLLSCLAYRTSLAIKLQPAKLTKETYKNFENVRSSISESSTQEIIELDYSIIYTLSVWEKIMTKQHSSLLTDIPERHVDGLKFLIKSNYKSHELFANNDLTIRHIQSFFLFLRQMLFDSTSQNFQKSWRDLNRYEKPLFILEVDFIYVLGSMLFIRYSLSNSTLSNINYREFLDKSNYNFHLVRLIYQFVSVQALLSLQTTYIDNISTLFHQLQTHSPALWSDENINKLCLLRESLRFRVNLAGNIPDLRYEEVAVGFSLALLPFLRCTAFLLDEMGSVNIPVRFVHCEAEFNELIKLLNLDLIPFENDVLPSYIDNHFKLINDLNLPDPKTMWNTPLPHTMPEKLPKLIDLPKEFTDVITIGLDRGCSLSQQATGTVSEMSICLICGVTVCLSGYCCRKIEESSNSVISGAQIHARQCHEGYALYLNTRNSKVVVLFYQARWQVSLDPVYLDRFGEFDIDLKRGSPLFLNEEAYAKLERSWLDHSVGCIVNDGFFSNDFFV